MIIGKSIHELIKEAEQKSRNPYMFKSTVISIL
jgi:hypothetical protein